MTTFTYTNPTVGGSEDTWGATLNANWTALGAFFGDLDSTEIAVLHGITASTAELNLLTGVTVTLADITATASELNLLDGVTATTTEINYIDGVTGPIQAQIDSKYEAATQSTAIWEAGTGTTESLVSPAKIKAAQESFRDANALGWGQTWQDVTSSRSSGTSYQNTTGRPIAVSVGNAGSGVFGDLQASSDGSSWVTVGKLHPNTGMSAYAVIPNGSYYRLTSWSGTFWSELR